MAIKIIKQQNRKYGFSLVEISVVLLIFGLMIGGIMSALTQETRIAKQAELKMKMDAIEKAIAAYVKKNNYLPCPADGTYTISAANFGLTGGTAGGGTCSNGATYDGNGNRTANTTPPTVNFYLGNIAGGVVPIRALGLPDEYGIDPWGGKFSYAVDKRFTATSSFITYNLISTTGGITVSDDGGNAIVSNAIAVVFSHGQNGHGAFQLSGSIKNSGSTNAHELVNCHCTSAAAAGVYSASFFTSLTTSTSSSDLRTVFDDNLRYYTRGSFLTNNDKARELK